LSAGGYTQEGGTNVVLDPADVVVAGAGAAGIYTALVAAEAGASVRLVSRSPLDESASYHAQGGLAAALASDDDPGLHLADTLAAGRGSVRESAARILCEEAPDRVRELEGRGVSFDREAPSGELALGLEGGHTRRRVAHAGGSATGRRVAECLAQRARENERIVIHERSTVVALWVEGGRCAGVVADSGGMPAGATVLATGGAAALWQRTTNPRGAVGTGLLLAHDAGAELGDLELLQFHPTALVWDGPRDGFLLTEAIRGEGAKLLNVERERFVDELAPRDEVARAIQRELDRRRAAHVFLDMREVDASRFPNVVAVLSELGLDPGRDLVPVAPAAHYMIGGIVAGVDGRSTLPGLYAVGECSCTGVHGANRLASNSLSECFVFGRRAALAAASDTASPAEGQPPPAGRPPDTGETTRAALWSRAGIVREAAGLAALAEDPHPLARLIGRAGLAREESRGCHLRSDFAATEPALDGRHFIIAQSSRPRLERWE
jgi:L-aspartate oxidase